MSEWSPHPQFSSYCCQLGTPVISHSASSQTNGASGGPSRRSRLDAAYDRSRSMSQAPQGQVTVLRTHSVRKLDPSEVSSCSYCCSSAPLQPPLIPTAGYENSSSVCCQTCCMPDSEMFLSSPFILKNTSTSHRSPTKKYCSPCGRNVHFRVEKNTQQHQSKVSVSRSPARRAMGCSPSPRSSSLVRVYSRACSPICKTIETSTLPSKSTIHQSCPDPCPPTCSIACECNIPPPCLPKPRERHRRYGIKRHHKTCQTKVETVDNCQPLFCCDVKLTPPTPPPVVSLEVKPELERCQPSSSGSTYQVSEHCTPRIQSVDCECQTCESGPSPTSSPLPQIERYERTSCRVERITTRRCCRRPLERRSFSCSRPATKPHLSYYLGLVDRRESELWNRITECEMDLAAFECTMCDDVVRYVKDALNKCHQLIDCDFEKIRRLCSYDNFHCNGDKVKYDTSSAAQELWQMAQRKYEFVCRMLNQIDRMRSNGWK